MTYTRRPELSGYGRMGPGPVQQVASSGGRNMFSDMYDGFQNTVGNFRQRMGQMDPRMAGTAAKGAVDNAVAGARSAYGGVKKFIPAAGGVLAVVGGGLEAKARLDRGEDGWRAAGGGLANTFGSGLAGAAGFSVAGPLGAMIAAPVGGAVAGWINDRVTDLQRGNDGKGTDAITADLDGQIQQAVNRGDNNRAMELTQQRQQLTAARQNANASPYQQGNRADASSYGVGPDGMARFNDMVNNVGIGQYGEDKVFEADRRRKNIGFEDTFGQQQRVAEFQDMIGARNLERLNSGNRTNEWSKQQAAIMAKAPEEMRLSMSDVLRNVYAAGGAGIR